MSDVSTQATTQSSRSQPTQLFQGVRCGALAVAFPYGWATSIVDKFELTPVPKAPAWLMGATNIDGRIMPVIDLSRYGAKGQRADRADAELSSVSHKRLLIGGVERENDDFRLAIAFNDLPQQISRPVSELETTADRAHGSMTDGFALSTRGVRYAVVNIERLFEQLSSELATL